jgi:hypothetical protein
MQTPQEIITNCFQEQSVRIISDIFENSDSELLSMEQIIENFKKMWGASETIIGNGIGSSSSSTKPKKITKKTSSSTEKVPRKRAIIPDNLRCIARKKDGDRCAAKAYAGGRNPKICTLHNNKGANFGMIIQEPEIPEIKDSDEELETNENTSVSSKLSKEEQEELFGDVSSDNEEIF